MTVPYPEDPQQGPYGYGYGYGGPPPPPYYPAPQRKSRTGLWISLGVVALIAVLAVVLTTVFFVTRKPVITELTAAMLIPESEFPSLPDAEFTEEPIEEDPELDEFEVDPVECLYMVQYPRTTQATSRSLDNDDDGFIVRLRINKEWPDLKAVLSECDSRQITFAEQGGTVRALDWPNLPDWAVAVELEVEDDESIGFVYASGYYRGVQIDTQHFGDEHSKSDRDEVVRMFNAQVDRLSEV